MIKISWLGLIGWKKIFFNLVVWIGLPLVGALWGLYLANTYDVVREDDVRFFPLFDISSQTKINWYHYIARLRRDYCKFDLDNQTSVYKGIGVKNIGDFDKFNIWVGEKNFKNSWYMTDYDVGWGRRDDHRGYSLPSEESWYDSKGMGVRSKEPSKGIFSDVSRYANVVSYWSWMLDLTNRQGLLVVVKKNLSNFSYCSYILSYDLELVGIESNKSAFDFYVEDVEVR